MSKPTKLTPATKEKSYYFFLVAGNVNYRVPSEKEENPIGTVMLNGVVRSSSSVLHNSTLAAAQSVLQHHFRNQVQDETIEIVLVVITAMIPMGYQTDSEFNDMNIPDDNVAANES